ncbi:hypothetical protein HN014_11010 [Aquimarina sp. TRL1]|uniref:dioxygenase family protein n=1 Tax=Aquimarina sp. (strain TRL1) TaxID=2736252 RepID=UPI0015894984|nr:hypothetical protein [Aquimarina sp. TRL1]QKX05421.1 hypothetical protein HN014_11010 [Aquimarina sp. TRL1]
MKTLRKWVEVYKTIWLIIPFTLSFSIQGQVDPRWLRHWNEADKKKPIEIPAASRIAAKDEQGIPLIIKGKIYNPDTTPAEGIIVHSYHRDGNGFDFGKNDVELTTWRLQGWAKTDKNGNFEFKTIRPAPDYLGREGAHIHFTTISKEFGRQWAPKVFLSDDPMLTEKQHSASKKAGKFGWISKVKEIKGIQYITVKIQLKEKGDF